MRYIGDDLVNLMTIYISPGKEGEELPEIAAIDVRMGPLVKHFDNPSNPFSIDVFREESVKLSVKNRCFACIWYWKVVNGERKLLKKTCEGTITLALNPEVINDGYKC